MHHLRAQVGPVAAEDGDGDFGGRVVEDEAQDMGGDGADDDADGGPPQAEDGGVLEGFGGADGLARLLDEVGEDGEEGDGHPVVEEGLAVDERGEGLGDAVVVCGGARKWELWCVNV